MVYSLTEKLNFDSYPQIQIKDRTITVQASAEAALRLFDLLDAEGEVKATLKAAEILFSEEDRQVIKDLHLSMSDYMTLLTTAMDLCVGNDPDSKETE